MVGVVMTPTILGSVHRPDLDKIMSATLRGGSIRTQSSDLPSNPTQLAIPLRTSCMPMLSIVWRAAETVVRPLAAGTSCTTGRTRVVPRWKIGRSEEIIAASPAVAVLWSSPATTRMIGPASLAFSKMRRASRWPAASPFSRIQSAVSGSLRRPSHISSNVAPSSTRRLPNRNAVVLRD